MIQLVKGDIFESKAGALVNPVNTMGVMGKGLALQFKKKYPDNFLVYRGACKEGKVFLGSMFVVETKGTRDPRYIINFPTKGHWKGPAYLGPIEVGLVDLVQVVVQLGLESIAIPALGCGEGGLSWTVVSPCIQDAFKTLPDVLVSLYEP